MPPRRALRRGAALREQAREAGGRAGDRNAELFADMLRVPRVLQRAEYGDADLGFVREDRQLSRRHGLPLLLRVDARGAGRHRGAREHLAIVAANDFAGLPFDANRLSSLGELAGACRALGDPETGAAVYELLTVYAGRPLTAGRAFSLGAADRALGDLAALLGRWDAAVEHYEAAIRLNEKMGMQPWAVHARLGLAAALAGRGDDDRARRLRAQGLDEAAALGLTGLLH